MRYVRSILFVLVAAFAAVTLAGCCNPPTVCNNQRTPAVMSIDPCYWWDPGHNTRPNYCDPLR
jgi:uncharacterized lipoprotein YajG